MYLAKRTKFLFPKRAPLSEEEIDDDLGMLFYFSLWRSFMWIFLLIDFFSVNYIGGLILRHLCQLVGNAHAITELKENENGIVQQVKL